MLTIVVPYYNQPGMLAAQARAWRDYPAGVEVIVVDDGSAVLAAADGCAIYRIDEDIPWHQDGARNLGAHVATGEWVLLLDIDHVLSGAELRRLLGLLPRLPGGVAYRPRRRLVATGRALGRARNIWLMRREDFWRVGGYDERLCGAYGSDLEFRPRVQRHLQEQDLGLTLDVYTAAEIADAATPGLDRKVVAPPRLAGPPEVLGFAWRRVQ